jgi:hypothetical protein
MSDAITSILTDASIRDSSAVEQKLFSDAVPNGYWVS